MNYDQNELGEESIVPLQENNSSDRPSNIEDDIPKTLNPKPMPLGFKLLFTSLILIVVGAVGYVVWQKYQAQIKAEYERYSSVETSESEPATVEAAKKELEDTAALSFPMDFDIPVINTPEDSSIISNVNGSPKPAIPKNRYEIPAANQTDIDIMATGEVGMAVTENNEMLIQDEGPAITISPMDYAVEQVEAAEVDPAAQEALIAERVQAALTKQSSDQIIIVKTSMELQEQAKQKLSSLVEKLDTLSEKIKLAESKPATPVVSNKTRRVNQSQSERPARKQPARQRSAPKKQAVRNEISGTSLVGIDLWAGERFAQLEHKGSLHLLAVNESLGEWKVSSISSSKIVMQHKEGDIVELRLH